MLVILFLGTSGIYLEGYLINHKSPDLNSADENLSNVLGSGPVTRKPVGVSLNISSPDDNILIFSPDLLVQGKTNPEAVILVTTDNNDQTINVGPDGSFSTTLKLKEGVNNLLISAFDSLGNSQVEKRTIYYSTDQLWLTQL